MKIMKYQDKPEISVLMSCYNASKWLNESIESILNQSLKNFEFILIDDGSTDNTWQIIQKYSKIDQRIVAINKKNTGLADSLNFGLSIAKGKWIARIDSDDISNSERLEKQFSFVQKNKEVVLLGSGFIEIDENNNIIKKHIYPSIHSKLVRNLERSGRFFPHSSVLFNLDIVRQIGGYNKLIKRAEDRYLWLELSLHGKLACIQEPLVYIRRHPDQISLEKNGRNQFCDSIAAEICHYLNKNGFLNPSKVNDINEWYDFRIWVERRLDQQGIFKKNNAWIAARNEYFKFNNSILKIFFFIKSLITSGYFINLLFDKLFGSSLSERLAKDWVLKKMEYHILKNDNCN